MDVTNEQIEALKCELSTRDDELSALQSELEVVNAQLLRRRRLSALSSQWRQSALR